MLRKISNSKFKFVFAVLFICMAMGAISSCSKSDIVEKESAANSLPQLNPGDGIKYKASVELYYRFCSSAYLVPKKTDIQFYTNEREEAAILRALIAGVGTNNVYTSTIPKEVKVVTMLKSNNTLFVTLDSEFLNNAHYDSDAEKRVAVCEILNTLSLYTNSTVQILIDKSGDGIGERVSYTELGFDSRYDENTDYAAPFGFTKSIVVNPAAILDYAIDCIKHREYAKAAPLFISESKKRGITADDIQAFSNGYEILTFRPILTNIGANTAEVSCVIELRDMHTRKTVKYEGNIKLIAHEAYYRIQFDRFTESPGGSN